MWSRGNIYHLFDVRLGAIGLLWFFVWQLAIHGSPSEHPTITPEEKDYIEESIAQLPKTKVNDQSVINRVQDIISYSYFLERFAWL